MTPTKQSKNWDIFDEPQRKAPAKRPKNWDIFVELRGKIPSKKPKKTYLRKTRVKPILLGDGAVARAKSMLQQQGLIKDASKTQRKNQIHLLA